MKILITGGAGFVGANLATYFQEKGNDVIVMDNLVRRGGEFNLPDFKKRNITFIHGDIRCMEDFNKLPHNIDVICECSAQPSATLGYGNPVYDLANNTIPGVMNVLEFCRKHGSALIFWSTNKTFSGDRINAFPRKELATRWVWDEAMTSDIVAGFNPDYGFSNEFSVDGGQHSIYGLSKIMSDLMCQEYYDAFGVKTVVNRWSCLAGPRQWGISDQGWVAWWAIAFQLQLPLKYIGWNGKQVRDVLFIDDICNLVDLEIQNIDKCAGQVFNAGGGAKNTLSLIEATNLLKDKFGINKKVEYEPQHRKADHCIYISDNRKIEQYTGWKPRVGIDLGYDQIIEWVEKNENKLRELYL